MAEFMYADRIPAEILAWGNELAQIGFSGQTGSVDQPAQMYHFRLRQPDFDFIVSILHFTPINIEGFRDVP